MKKPLGLGLVFAIFLALNIGLALGLCLSLEIGLANGMLDLGIDVLHIFFRRGAHLPMEGCPIALCLTQCALVIEVVNHRLSAS